MNDPMIVWFAIAGVLLLAFVVRAVEKHCAGINHADCKPRRIHVIEIGKEKDMFYIPGDLADDEEDVFDDM